MPLRKLRYGVHTLLEQPDFVIQKKLKCHASIAEIYSGSVNTFRIVTYLWHGNIIHCPLVLRIGRGNACVDNASSGGMFIAVDDDGTLHANARTEFGLSFSEHPDTHIIFEGRKISFVDKLITAVKKMHSQIPQVGMINWDFTIDQEGSPVMIEGNMFYGGGYFLVQESHERGILGDNTAEILQWLREIQKAKRTERPKFMYGKILQH